MSTIRCFYSCSACRLVRQYVEVAERDPKQQDVVQWIQQTATPALVADHQRKSPLCRPKTFAEVGIPVDEATEHVGTRSRS